VIIIISLIIIRYLIVYEKLSPPRYEIERGKGVSSCDARGLRSLRSRDPLGVAAQVKSLVTPAALLWAFLFPFLLLASGCRPENKKALVHTHQGF